MLPASIPDPVSEANRIIVGFSGGVDSIALLHAAGQRFGPRVLAVHIDHGLQADSEHWAARSRETCLRLGLPIIVERVNVKLDEGKGIESAARAARYRVFQQQLSDGDVLALAHHLDDQAETVLLRLFRGAGLQGLAGMRALRPFADGWLWRPFLGRRRSEIAAYADHHKLVGIDDPHNRDSRFARSFVRHDLLPGIEQQWPAVSEVLARTAEVLAEAADLQQEFAKQDLVDAANVDGSVSVDALLKLSSARRSNVLKYWIESREFPPGSRDSVKRIDSEVLHARDDANPCLKWPGVEVRRFHNSLYVMEPLGALERYSLNWDGAAKLMLPGELGHLECFGNIPLDGSLEVRNSQGGERFVPAGTNKSRSLKNLSQERAIPPWVRQRMPMIVFDGKLLWVAGLGWSEDGSTTLAISGQPPRIHWETELPGAIQEAVP